MRSHGLDSDRDTEAEVETVIRFFPEVLSRRKEYFVHGIVFGFYYPIQLLAIALTYTGIWTCKVKTVSFIPIVARLAIEFGLFKEDERGGLLCKCDDVMGYRVPHYLLVSACDSCNQEHHDDTCLEVLVKLRQLDLLKREDIQSFSLLSYLCRRPYFPEKRFRFLVEWDLNALLHPNQYGQIPLYDSIDYGNIQNFQMTFEAGIKYFPKKKGIHILFRKTNRGMTPLQKACGCFRYQMLLFGFQPHTLSTYL
jgi:hypothetical protein